MDNILITGTTSGLGRSLESIFVENGYSVTSMNRSMCDFSLLEEVKISINKILDTVDNFKYVFLNAGTLGDLKPARYLDVEEQKEVFNINFWANKVIIDSIINADKCKTIIAISSGAANKSYFGWSSYCCSKSALKQLLSCYTDENENMRFLSLAPGVVKTKMQDIIYMYDENKIPSVKKFKDMYETMQTPEECAKKIFENMSYLFGSNERFIDLRDL